MKFVSVSQLLVWPLFESDSGPFTALGFIASLVGEKKKEREREREKKERKKEKSLLLALNCPSEFCWSSRLQQAEWGCIALFSLPVVL